MLELDDDIEETGYYKSVIKETLLKAAQKLLKKGQSVEEIADIATAKAVMA